MNKEELQKRIKHLTSLRELRLKKLQNFYAHIPQNPAKAMKAFQAEMNEMIDYTMELEKTIKDIMNGKLNIILESG